MDLLHLIPDVVRSVWVYYQQAKDRSTVLPGRATWQELSAWYFTWGHQRVSDPVQFPEVLVDALFQEVEIYPGIRCSALAAWVVQSEFGGIPESLTTARRALGWYYLFRMNQFGQQFEFIVDREVELTSRLVSSEAGGAPALELVARIQTFAEGYSELAIISEDPLVTLGWLFCEKRQPFFEAYWRHNAEFFLSDRANALFDVHPGEPFIAVCAERYRRRVDPQNVCHSLDWSRNWLRSIAPDLASCHGGFFVAGGVNLVGAVAAESGIGEDVRLMARVLEDLKIPFAIIPFPREMLSPLTNAEFADRWSDTLVYDVTLICLPPEEVLHLWHTAGRGFFEGRYNIGYFPVELKNFPPQLECALDLVQEVWCMSHFIRDGLPRTFAKPAELMPAVVQTTRGRDATSQAKPYGPKGTFVFLCCFDALSYIERKNPIGAIEAFRQAFGDDEAACLVVKTMNLDKAPAELADRLRSYACKNVIIIDEIYSRQQMQSLIAGADALVSLHRAEGFGRVLAEAMICGVPLIASGYSRSLDYADEETAFIVEGQEVPVAEGAYPYGVGNMWFEPSQQSACQQMLEVFRARNTEALARKTAAGRMRIVERHGVEAAAGRIGARLAKVKALRAVWPERRNSIFDRQFYLGMSPDLREKADPPELFRHYCSHGFHEGRAASRSIFNAKYRSMHDARSCPVRLAVFIHCYYVDQVQELARYLRNLDFIEPDVHVNLVQRPGVEEDVERVRAALPTARIFFGENRGRDIGGLLNVLAQIDRSSYDLCLVLHTKSSPQNKGTYSSVWKEDLIGCLIRDPVTAYRNLAMFTRPGSRVGAIGALNWRSESMCANEVKVRALFTRFGIPEDKQALEYISGSMMFIRMEVLERLAAEVSFSEFELCDGKPKEFFVDGQLEHAVERVLGSLVHDRNLTIEWVQ